MFHRLQKMGMRVESREAAVFVFLNLAFNVHVTVAVVMSCHLWQEEYLEAKEKYERVMNRSVEEAKATAELVQVSNMS